MAEIILKGRYKIENLNEGISLSEAIDGISYNATVELVETQELKNIGLFKGDSIVINDTNFETQKKSQVFKGIVWEIDKNQSVANHLSLDCKEKSIYFESEDEYLFPAGQTAKQRAVQYCKDWSIPQGNLAETYIHLSRALYRNNTINDMMKKDLKETAQKGGNLYKYRMIDKLDIVEIGSNSTIWKLETISEGIKTVSSLNGMVTQVKVLGKQEDNKKSPVVGMFKKNTDKYGTMQKIIQDEKVNNATEGKKRAETLFNTGEESVKVNGIDINSIRAGDKVSLNNVILYVIDVTHNLGSPGKMDLNLTSLSEIRRRFYSGDDI